MMWPTVWSVLSVWHRCSPPPVFIRSTDRSQTLLVSHLAQSDGDILWAPFVRCSVCVRRFNNDSMRHCCEVGNLTYSRALRVRSLAMITRRYDRQITACKNGLTQKQGFADPRVFTITKIVKLTTTICTSTVESLCIIPSNNSLRQIRNCLLP
jgi:hypothetical protein